MSKIKLPPKQLYVVGKPTEYAEWKYDRSAAKYTKIEKRKTILGFLHPHEPTTQPDKKRKETQNYWAYDSMYMRDGVAWDRGYRWGNNGKVPFDEPIPLEYAPQVWDNTPRNGFRLVDTVSRQVTSNKLFLVLDPRGMEFEVTAVSLFQILMNGSVVKGEIVEPCVWMNSKNLVLAS
jgi:hypothetical protein